MAGRSEWWLKEREAHLQPKGSHEATTRVVAGLGSPEPDNPEKNVRRWVAWIRLMLTVFSNSKRKSAGDDDILQRHLVGKSWKCRPKWWPEYQEWNPEMGTQNGNPGGGHRSIKKKTVGIPSIKDFSCDAIQLFNDLWQMIYAIFVWHVRRKHDF